MLINDDFIKKTSLALSILGIIALFVLSKTIEARNVAIGDITGNMIGNKIKVTGIITELYWHDGHLFFTLSENRDEIKIVMFERDAKKFPALQNLTKNDEVIVSGSVNEYERELEIVAKETVITSSMYPLPKGRGFPRGCYVDFLPFIPHLKVWVF